MRFALKSILILLFVSRSIAAEPGVVAVQAAQVAAATEAYLLIDVRSQMEWEIMRIPGARNLPAGSIREGDLLDLRGPEGKPTLVFYANSNEPAAADCAAAAAKLGFKSVAWLEGGVNEWSQRYPSRTLFLDAPLDLPSVAAQRIKREEFESALLPVGTFLEAAGSGQFQLLDIRHPHQRVKKGTLPGKPILLTPDDFLWSLRRNAIVASQRVLIADYDGALLPWLQYHLLRFGIKDYAFLRGGQRGIEAAAAKTN